LSWRAPEFYDAIYKPKTISAPHEANTPNFGETFITMPVWSGRCTAPMPIGYEIVGIKLLNREGETIKEGYPIKLRECIFGSAQIEIPSGVHSITYCIKECERKVSPLVVDTLRSKLPQVSVYLGVEGEALREAMALFPIDDYQRMQLLFQHQVKRGFTFSGDYFVREFTRSSGTALGECIAGLRAGTSDPFAYFVAAMYLQHSIPSLVVSGTNAHSSARRAMCRPRFSARTGRLLSI
jgi:hypothetical protein